MAALRHRLGSTGRQRATLQLTHERMAQSQKKYQTLPEHHRLRAKCEEAALIAWHKKQQERAAQMLKVEEKLMAARFKKRFEGWKGLPPRLIFSEAAFSLEQAQQLTDLMNGPAFSMTRVAELRKAALTHSMLSETKFAQLNAIKILQTPADKVPWWLPVVCHCREAFVGTALRIGAGSRAYSKFLFAKKSFQLAGVAPLQLEEQWTELLDTTSGAADICSPLCKWLYSFTCDRLAISMAHELDDNENSEVFVLVGVVDDGRRIVADGPEYNLAQYVAGLQQLEKMGKERKPSRRAALKSQQKEAWAKEVAEFPWLAAPAAERPTKRPRPGPSPAAAGSTDEPAGSGESDEEEEPAEESAVAEKEELDDVEEDIIFAELDKQRKEWADKYGDQQLSDFTSGLLGGKGTFKAAGVVADYVCCEASTKHAKAFVKKYGLHASKRANIELYDGSQNATIIVTGWGHKMQYYLDVFRRSGNAMYRFTPGDHKSYVEQDEFSQLANTSQQFLDVARKIRSVQPSFALC